MGGADRNQTEIYQQIQHANHIHNLLNDKTISQSEKSALELKSLALGQDLEEKERLLVINKANIKTCREVAENTEKQLLEGCIEKLKKKYTIENQVKERKLAHISTKLFDIEKYYANANKTIAKVEKEKDEILIELEVKEAFFQEEREHKASRIKEYVNAVEKLQEEKAKIESEKEKAIEQVKTEIENKVNERLTHHNKELAIERNKLNAKDKHLRKVYKQRYALNKELYQMKEQCESKEEREHQAGRMKKCVAEVEELKVKIQDERTERKKATEKLQVVEKQNRKIMEENEELKMKLKTFMKNSNDVKEIIIPTDNSSVLLVNDVATLEPIVCKVATASHFHHVIM